MKHYFWAAWNRQNDWSFSGVQLCGALPSPWKNWSLGPNGTTTPIALSPFFDDNFYPTLPVVLLHKSRGFLVYKIRIGTGSWFVISSTPNENTISLVENESEVWRKSKPETLRLVGYDNDEFAVVSWENVDVADCVVEVYRLNDGKMTTKLDLSQDFRSVYRAQISHGRIAIRGLIYDLKRKPDVKVYDPKTGNKLLECGSCFKDSNNVEQFVLFKEKIVFLERLQWPDKRTTGRIFIAKFWA